MNSTDRTEFDSQLAVLCAGMDVPCTQERKEAYWKGLQQMSLSIFVRTVDFILAKETWARIPKPGQVWEVSRRMRAAGPPPPPKDDGFRGDDWDAIANRYLLGYLTKRLEKRMAIPGRAASASAMVAQSYELRVRGLDTHLLDASPEFVFNVEVLVKAKNAWAVDMRDLAQNANGEVPPSTQQAVWYGYIKQAEAVMRA